MALSSPERQIPVPIATAVSVFSPPAAVAVPTLAATSPLLPSLPLSSPGTTTFASPSPPPFTQAEPSEPPAKRWRGILSRKSLSFANPLRSIPVTLPPIPTTVESTLITAVPISVPISSGPIADPSSSLPLSAPLSTSFPSPPLVSSTPSTTPSAAPHLTAFSYPWRMPGYEFNPSHISDCLQFIFGVNMDVFRRHATLRQENSELHTQLDAARAQQNRLEAENRILQDRNATLETTLENTLRRAANLSQNVINHLDTIATLRSEVATYEGRLQNAVQSQECFAQTVQEELAMHRANTAVHAVFASAADTPAGVFLSPTDLEDLVDGVREDIQSTWQQEIQRWRQAVIPPGPPTLLPTVANSEPAATTVTLANTSAQGKNPIQPIPPDFCAVSSAGSSSAALTVIPVTSTTSLQMSTGPHPDIYALQQQVLLTHQENQYLSEDLEISRRRARRFRQLFFATAQYLDLCAMSFSLQMPPRPYWWNAADALLQRHYPHHLPFANLPMFFPRDPSPDHRVILTDDSTSSSSSSSSSSD